MDQWSDEKIQTALSKRNSVQLRVRKAFEELVHPFTSLVLIEARDYSDVKNEVIELYGKGFEIIYLALNSGFSKIKQDCEREKKDCSHIFFIDMVSIESGAKTIEGEPKVTYLKSPLDLTEAISSIDKRFSISNGKKTMVVLDSVSTMLIYNDVFKVEKFMHTLLGKVNASNASAIVFSSDFNEKEGITSTIGQFFEKTLKI
ncbi:MAG TPA: hypothetical protein VJG83_03455 [archaeon]|nr:hypothetical protein [archaeon]